ncbi:MAG: hypothetical protein IJM99_09110 [Firmicutes bacterium]|nr:hypothetical protein [Bacillota bacterium]
MSNSTKRLTTCSLMTAVGVVLMVLGSMLGIATYAMPMIVGLALIPLGKRYGTKYHLTVFAATALLSLLLVSDVEQSLLFLAFLGWYPALRPRLQRIKPKILRVLMKLIVFNVPVVLMEWILMTLLVPESMDAWFLWILLILGNITFIVYDVAMPKFEFIMERYMGRILGK